jgi:ElaB/YqjD/DUF883 family membrane-anchored ribosome-binding protein
MPKLSSGPATAEDLKDRVGESAEEILERLSRHAAEAEAQIRRSAEVVERHAQAAGREALGEGEEMAGAVSAYLRQHPLAAVGLAFGAGIVAAALLRR